MTDEHKPKGRPLALDPDAVSSEPGTPAFLSPPPGAPAYHGFPVLTDVCAEGFTLGKITDFEAEACECGDGFVVAPDGRRCGLIWESMEQGLFRNGYCA